MGRNLSKMGRNLLKMGRNLFGTKSVKIRRGTKSVWDEICHILLSLLKFIATAFRTIVVTKNRFSECLILVRKMGQESAPAFFMISRATFKEVSY